MSNKLLITVLTVVIVGPFTYMATSDALSIKQHLQAQHQHIQQLSTESAKLDTQINKAVETKKQSQAEVAQYEQQTQASLSERQKLEAELGAN